MFADSTKVIGKHAVEAGYVDPADSLRYEIQDLRQEIEKLKLAINSPQEGWHNARVYCREEEWFDQIEKGTSYHDQSVVMIVPALKPLPHAVYGNYLALMTGANQQIHRMKLVNYEVGDAYEQAVAKILENEELCNFSAILTMEADNVIPPMAILQLFKDMQDADVDVVGAMYWGKGEGGVPMAYGRFGETPHNFRPFVPPPRSVTRVNGVGMGCTLFKLDIFKKVSRPWFKTFQQWTPNVGMESLATQDLWFARKAAQEAGVKFAVSTNVLVGHLDEKRGSLGDEQAV